MVVLEGRSIKFPCHYEPQYASYVKYWCQGRMREFCTSLARTGEAGVTNPAEDKVSVVDDQVQQVFTVTMNNLREGDSGWYMCGVEVGSGWTADVATFTYIRVIHGKRPEWIPQLCRLWHDFNLLLQVCRYSTTSWVGRKGATSHLTASTVRDTGTWSPSSSFCFVLIRIHTQPSLDKQG